MASLAEQIPLELLRADRKFEAIDFIRALGLPSRFGRKMLQDWGEAVLAELNSTDYQLVVRKVRLET